MTAPTEIISLSEVTKIFRTSTFKKKTAVNNLTFSIDSGEVVGLLGPNGSGKSTTIKMLLGFIRPTSGEVLVQGKSPLTPSTRAHIGYLPENPRFQKFLTARELLKYLGALYGLSGKSLDSRVNYLLELVNLSDAAGEKVGGFSKGMVQRLAIAQAIMNSPKLLIFDEPMSGLDPVGRNEIRKLVLTIRSELPHTSVFFSTHVLDDIESLCTRVAVLKKGHLQEYCSAREILERIKDQFEIVVIPPTETSALDKELFASATKLPLGWSIPVSGIESLTKSLELFSKLNFQIIGIHNHRRPLEEDIFLQGAKT